MFSCMVPRSHQGTHTHERVSKKFTKRPRYVYAFDSFSGMPPPGINDTSSQGIHAESTGWGTGTCAAPVESVMEITSQLGALDLLCTVKGYFEDTLHHYSAKIPEIALLHLDGDWYESTKTCLLYTSDAADDA